MGSIGMPELIIILVIALVIFGPGKLPQLGSSIGKAFRNLKKAVADQDGHTVELPHENKKLQAKVE
jgi:sec-independent protein translocase protein TatA